MTGAVIDGRASFDYSALYGSSASEAREAAARIRARSQRMVESIIESGVDLLAVKATLAHGEFGIWLRTECDLSERTARNFMAAAARFQRQIGNGCRFEPHHALRAPMMRAKLSCSGSSTRPTSPPMTSRKKHCGKHGKPRRQHGDKRD